MRQKQEQAALPSKHRELLLKFKSGNEEMSMTAMQNVFDTMKTDTVRKGKGMECA